MCKELKQLMKKNNLTLIRMKNSAVWKHISGGIVITSKKRTPPAIKNIKNDIRKVVGFVM